jgi:hypothetical protein
VRAALRRGCARTPSLDVGGHCVLDVDGAVRAAGSTVPTYRLTVTKAGKGSGLVDGSGAAIQCGLFCTDRLDAGTTLTLTAAPVRGSRFVRWTGACRGSKPVCSLGVAGNTTLGAVFARR